MAFWKINFGKKKINLFKGVCMFMLDYQQDSLIRDGKVWLVVRASIILHIKFL